MLVLRHDYPRDSPNQTLAFVDIEHLLESIKISDMEKGAWVNLIGYKTPAQPKSYQAQGVMQKERHVYLQAVMLWSAGAVKLDAYEMALASRLENGT